MVQFSTTEDSSSFSALSYFSLKVLVFDSGIKSVLFCQHRDKPCQEAEKSVLHIINLRPPIHKQSSRNFLQSSTGLKKMENKILMDSEAMRIIQLPAFTPFSLKSCYVRLREERESETLFSHSYSSLGFHPHLKRKTKQQQHQKFSLSQARESNSCFMYTKKIGSISQLKYK